MPTIKLTYTGQRIDLNETFKALAVVRMSDDPVIIQIPRGSTLAPFNSEGRSHWRIVTYGTGPRPRTARQSGDRDTGITINQACSDIGINGLDLTAFRINILLDPGSTGFIDDVTLEDNLIADARSGGADAHGIFCDYVRGLRLIRNLFDDNGDETTEGANDDIRDHHIYMVGGHDAVKSCGEVYAEGNVYLNAREGGQYGGGGIWKDNIYLDNWGGPEIREKNPSPTPVLLTMIGNTVVGVIKRGPFLHNLKYLTMRDNVIICKTPSDIAQRQAVGVSDDGLPTSLPMIISDNYQRGFTQVKDPRFNFPQWTDSVPTLDKAEIRRRFGEPGFTALDLKAKLRGGVVAPPVPTPDPVATPPADTTNWKAKWELEHQAWLNTEALYAASNSRIITLRSRLTNTNTYLETLRDEVAATLEQTK